MITFFKHFIFSILILFIFFACEKNKTDSINDEPPKPIEVEISAEQKAIINFVDSLTLQQKIAQLFLVSVDGTNAKLSATTHPEPPGGYILFSRNTADGARPVVTLIGDTITHYSNNNEVLPYFSIDHEGGIVNRLRGVASPLPSAQQVSSKLSSDLAQELYSYSAMQLKALGIHVNIGPMAEAGYKSNFEFTGTRSYGNREKTVLYSKAFLDGFRSEGIYCIVKHLPGNTNDDPHYVLPKLIGSKDVIETLYIEPFRTLVENDGLLMSHVIVPSFDENNPACLSPTFINDVVHQSLNFNGLVFSDDILMNALLENGYPPEVAIEMALKAGVNVLMISHPAYWNIIPIVEGIVDKDTSILSYINESVIKIIEAKVLMGLYTLIPIELEGETKSYILEKTPVEDLYNVEKQMDNFIVAKELGEIFYSKYW